MTETYFLICRTLLFLLPTDTCYGLAGEFNEQDYQEIYRLKGRDFVKPLAWLVRDYEDLRQYIEITDEQIEFLKKYPRPWSILGKKREDYVLPDFLDAKTYEKISLRVATECLFPILPSYHPTILPFPLFLTSANISGNPELKTLAEARGVFSGIDGIDGGVCDQPPSDIFRFLESGEVEYLRRS